MVFYIVEKSKILSIIYYSTNQNINKKYYYNAFKELY